MVLGVPILKHFRVYSICVLMCSERLETLISLDVCSRSSFTRLEPFCCLTANQLTPLLNFKDTVLFSMAFITRYCQDH